MTTKYREQRITTTREGTLAKRQTKLGFVGAGRMATALARGCVQAGLIADGNLLACDPSKSAREAFSLQLPTSKLFATSESVFSQADAVVLATKPQVVGDALAEIRDLVEPRHLLISIAAGVTLERLAAGLPDGTRAIRVMPNTPCLIGLGASCYSRGQHATDADVETVNQILQSVGEAHEVIESQLDAVTGLSGSGPAFIYEAIDALARGGTAMGLPAELALSLAAQTARGAATMIQETGLSPAELRDQVTSPGGTTLAGLESLRRDDAVAAFARAVEAATQRSIELGHS